MVYQSTLKYPKKSHRKIVQLPQDSIQLAEFMGIMIGDGGINNDWQANETLNTDADADYVKHVSALMGELFAAHPVVRARKTKRATVISLASVTVVDFLVGKGISRGNKLLQGLKIPSWILSEKAYKIACVRGLVDTDGCLILHSHTVMGSIYRNLYLSFSSASPILLEQVTQIFLDIGLTPYLATSKREINVYKIDDVEKYLKIVGTSNERIRRVYRKWRGG